MSDLRSMNEYEKQNFLMKRGAALGLTTAEVMDYLMKYGPYVVELLFKLLEWKRTPQGAAHSATFIGDNMLKQLLLSFLISHKKEILSWIEAGEGAIFEALVKMIAGKNEVLAALLEQYKATVLTLDDPLAVSAIDAVIAALKGLPTPGPTPPPFIPPFIPQITAFPVAEKDDL